MSTKPGELHFEMANRYRNSACGVVDVRDERVVERAYELIRPPFRLSEFTPIHNLSRDDVAGAASFDRVWRKLAPLPHGSTFLAAHNAPFDRGVLRACCERYGLEAPETPFDRTVKLARARSDLHPSRLPDVARPLGSKLNHQPTRERRRPSTSRPARPARSNAAHPRARTAVDRHSTPRSSE